MRAIVLSLVLVGAVGCSNDFSGPTGSVRRLAAFVEDAAFDLGPADENGIFSVVVRDEDKQRYSDVFATIDTMFNGQILPRGRLYDALPTQMLEDLPLVEIRSIESSGPGVVTMVLVRPDLPRFRDRLHDITLHAPHPRATPSKLEQATFQQLLTVVRREVPTVDTLYFAVDSTGRIAGYRSIQSIRDSVRQDSLTRVTLSAFDSWLGRATNHNLEVRDWSSPAPLQIPAVIISWEMVATGVDAMEVGGNPNVWVSGECFGTRGADSTTTANLTLDARTVATDRMTFNCAWISEKDLAEWRRVRPVDVWARITVRGYGQGSGFSRLVHVAPSPKASSARQ